MKTLLWPRKVKNLTQDHMTGGWRAGIGGRPAGLHLYSKPPSHTALIQNLSVSDSSCVKKDLHVFYAALLCQLTRPIQLTESVLSYCPSMPLTLIFTRICLCSYCSFCLECSLHFPLSTYHMLLLANTCSLLKIQFRVCYHLRKTPGCPCPLPTVPSPLAPTPISIAYLHHSINHKMEKSISLSVSLSFQALMRPCLILCTFSLGTSQAWPIVGTQ